jgi:predicted nucleotidyltransferase
MKLGTIQDREKSLKEELGRIVTVIQSEYDPDKIILFGSLVSEAVHEWSDIDLLVIKKTDKRPIERIMELTHLICPRVGIDLFIYTPEEIELLLKERYPFLLNILKTGKTVYEKRSRGGNTKMQRKRP